MKYALPFLFGVMHNSTCRLIFEPVRLPGYAALRRFIT